MQFTLFIFFHTAAIISETKQILKNLISYPKNIHEFLKTVYLISTNSLPLSYLFFSDSVQFSKLIISNFSLMEPIPINYKPISGTLVFTACVTLNISPITKNDPQNINNSFSLFFSLSVHAREVVILWKKY